MQAFLTQYGRMILEATGETLYMTILSVIFSYLFGILLGVLAYSTQPGSIAPNRPLFAVLDWLINMLRSFPFIILILALIPVTRMVMGKAIGPTAMVFPLVVGASPFVARLVESSFNELDRGVIESARAMGATNWQIVTRVLLPESMPSLLRGMSISTITIIGYTAMAGAVGGRGLGDVAIRYGFHRYQYNVMIVTVIVLILIVQIIQTVFHLFVKKIDRNK